MDLDRESLLKCFCEEEKDEKDVIEWCKEQHGPRSDIFEPRLDLADALREEGNAFFKESDWDACLRRYFAAVWQLDFDVGQQWNFMDKHSYELNTRKLKVISNICAAYLKKGDYQKTKWAADVGLRHIEKAELKEPQAEAKFHYRKGIANLRRGFSENAYESLKKAETISPGDKQVREALKTAHQEQKVDRQKAKVVWRDKLLSEEEKACQVSWIARCRRRAKRCSHRKDV